MKTRQILILTSVFLVVGSLLVSPVLAQEEQTEEQTQETNLTAEEVEKILDNDSADRIDEVKAWVNSDVSEENPDLKEKAQTWIEEQEKEQSDGEEQTNETEAPNVTPEEIHTIIEQDWVSQIAVVQQWVNSDASSEYPELRKEAQNWMKEQNSSDEFWNPYNYTNTTDEPDTIERQVGENIYIMGSEWVEDAVILDLRVTEQTRVTITDSTGVFAKSTGQVGQKRSMDLPPGDYQIKVKATAREDGYQAISLDPPDNKVYGFDHNYSAGGDSVWNELVPIKWSFIGLMGFTLVSLIYVGHKFRSRNTTGAIENSEGVEITGGRVYGSKMEPEDRSFGGDDQ